VQWIAATSEQYVSHPADADAALRELLRTGQIDERLVFSADRVAEALAALHRALAAPSDDPNFGTWPLRDDDLAAWRADAHADLAALLESHVPGIAAARDAVGAEIDALPKHIDAASSRAHGRLTLRRVLFVENGPIFVGFGERLAERSSPLKDVASLARSFDAIAREAVIDAGHDPTTDLGEARILVREITAKALHEFIERYAGAAGDLATVPRDATQRNALIRFFRVRGALRELRLAAERRPQEAAAALDALLAECR
jgi:maltose alpha-D-glucosyltransferase/alpha-amylase